MSVRGTYHNGKYPDSSRPDVGFYCGLRAVDAGTQLIPPRFHYSQDAVVNQAMSAWKRYGREMPVGDRSERRRFLNYSKGFIKSYVPRLAKADVPTMKEWLTQSKYTQAVKRQFEECWEDLRLAAKDWVNFGAFLKDEDYDVAKIPRTINGPTMRAKILIAYLQYAMDKKLAHDPLYSKWCVKGTDPKDWPKRLESMFGGRAVYNTDFSSFECHHRGEMAEVNWYWHRHMLRDVDVTACQWEILHHAIKGVNKNRLSGANATIDETLMSGVSWTSMSNQLLNLLICSYLTLRSRYPGYSNARLIRRARYFVGLFEGDDGFFEYFKIRARFIANLGVALDLDYHQDYSTAGFCSIQIDRVAQQCCVDFNKVLRTFFKLPIKYAGAKESKCLALLRARALSYIHVAGSSPMTAALAHRVCELTKGHDVRHILHMIDDRKIEYVEAALRDKSYLTRKEITLATREAYERAFKVPVARQLAIEAQITAAQLDTGFQLDIADWFTAQEWDISLRFISEHPGRVNIPVIPDDRYHLFVTQGKRAAQDMRAGALRRTAPQASKRWSQWLQHQGMIRW